MITKGKFDNFDKYTISSENLSVTVTTLGATCTSIIYKGQEIALSYETAQEYIDGDSYIGAIVGRYANRLKDSKITIDGKVIDVTPNEGKNQLHGGPNAFDKQEFKAEEIGDNAVKFTIVSPDGENGYPGNLTASFTYTVNGDSFKIDFEGDADKDTVFAPTTHLYFNLGGAEDILDTELYIPADYFVEVDSESIPTVVLPVDDYYDFRYDRPIENFIDNTYILNKDNEELACIATDNGIEMTLHTDYPGLQLYSGKFLNGKHKPFGGFAVEPGLNPNSPNREDFPDATLRAGQHFHKYVSYDFKSV